MYRSFLAFLLGTLAAFHLSETSAHARARAAMDLDGVALEVLAEAVALPTPPDVAEDPAPPDPPQSAPQASGPDLTAASVNDEPGVSPERMRPLGGVPEAGSALTLYPDNDALVNPFGQGVELACEGLMEWLAPRNGGRWHSGLDLVPRVGPARGRKLYAPGDGYVLRRQDWHPAWGSYLLAVFRKGDHLYLTGFFHLKARSHSHLEERDIEKGITGRITRGQLLGKVGRTGAARGAHLHLDVIQVRKVVPPDELSRVVWQGRKWDEFVHPASVLDGLPAATYRDRARPDHGLIVRAYQPGSGARPS